MIYQLCLCNEISIESQKEAESFWVGNSWRWGCHVSSPTPGSRSPLPPSIPEVQPFIINPYSSKQTTILSSLSHQSKLIKRKEEGVGTSTDSQLVRSTSNNLGQLLVSEDTCMCVCMSHRLWSCETVFYLCDLMLTPGKMSELTKILGYPAGDMELLDVWITNTSGQSLQYCSRKEKKYKSVLLFTHITKNCSKSKNQSTAFSHHHLIILAWCSSLPSKFSRVPHNYDHSKKKNKKPITLSFLNDVDLPHHAPFPKCCSAFLNFITICHFSS